MVSVSVLFPDLAKTLPNICSLKTVPQDVSQMTSYTFYYSDTSVQQLYNNFVPKLFSFAPYAKQRRRRWLQSRFIKVYLHNYTSPDYLYHWGMRENAVASQQGVEMHGWRKHSLNGLSPVWVVMIQLLYYMQEQHIFLLSRI